MKTLIKTINAIQGGIEEVRYHGFFKAQVWFKERFDTFKGTYLFFDKLVWYTPAISGLLNPLKSFFFAILIASELNKA